MDAVGSLRYLGTYLFPTDTGAGGSPPFGRGQILEGRMPTYEYRCRDCHHVFDRVEPLAQHGDRRPNCPKCKSKNVEQVLTPFFAKTSHKS